MARHPADARAFGNWKDKGAKILESLTENWREKAKKMKRNLNKLEEGAYYMAYCKLMRAAFEPAGPISIIPQWHVQHEALLAKMAGVAAQERNATE